MVMQLEQPQLSKAKGKYRSEGDTAQPGPLSVGETVCPGHRRMRFSTDSGRKDGKGRVLVGWAGEGEVREIEDACGVRVGRGAGEMEGTRGWGGELGRWWLLKEVVAALETHSVVGLEARRSRVWGSQLGLRTAV